MEVKLINTERALALTSIELADFVVNPYRGCGFGCDYCYAKSNKNIRKELRRWGDYVYIKKNITEILEDELYRELESGKIKRILIGSTTDPFQGCEKEYGLTKGVLKILARKDIPVTILTKSVGVLNYIDLLKYSNRNYLYFTFNDEKVRELFEYETAKQSKRLEVIEKIYLADINIIVYISPVFPGITRPSEIMKFINGKCKKLYFEGYNIKLGNWEIVSKKLPKDILSLYKKIFFDEEEYNKYWNNLKNEINKINRDYNYEIEFFIYPHEKYYNE